MTGGGGRGSTRLSVPNRAFTARPQGNQADGERGKKFRIPVGTPRVPQGDRRRHSSSFTADGAVAATVTEGSFRPPVRLPPGGLNALVFRSSGHQVKVASVQIPPPLRATHTAPCPAGGGHSPGRAAFPPGCRSPRVQTWAPSRTRGLPVPSEPPWFAPRGCWQTGQPATRPPPPAPSPAPFPAACHHAGLDFLSVSPRTHVRATRSTGNPT